MNNSLITWLNNEIIRNQHYHNHKETMAWLATVLYLTGTITLSSKINGLSSCDKTLAIILFILTSVGAYSFISWQFDNRWKAARKIAALIHTYTLLEANPKQTIDLTFNKDHALPEFVVKNLPDENLLTDRAFSEFTSYGIMLLALIWFIANL